MLFNTSAIIVILNNKLLLLKIYKKIKEQNI